MPLLPQPLGLFKKFKGLKFVAPKISPGEKISSPGWALSGLPKKPQPHLSPKNLKG